ncbi:TetR/AcrR family transcriptional regulator [Eubacterium coprostanoligenes]|uniref:Transcriptional regulator, TetR family n=1 Tax=Eubacterium coprostanoligenes TaxID=290054 RepID=A0A1T4MNH9_9FIRM|nr:TetR/AcrR family transcriptional regulator [Eubacterium coprostanoligenes]MCI6354101.1 TetR/AcrR family transcriptional regulator [Eubacterium coprostanoligenes]MCI6360813.1 TetR/AcrR family transcriptional regulator [Eubacterium coprostanoligenes]MDD7357847.1 TetR/AcrR family transcriptional regulator [Eubacterium coprostanoligenes]MDY4699303.1 TetR/AcrR family transcriptional regulator [Eubacterium coprostanoligenes]SJZ68431.1 transcriptional regulator, TetR family [Eubacterium coprostano
MFEKRYKEAFERATDERKEKILEVGIKEFASKGYEKANINIIAKKAGISIGLMYKYFSTKEDLFITCIQRGMSILDDAIDEILQSDDKLIVKAEKLIRTTCQLSQRDANYVKLYNEITSERDSEKAMEFAKAIEGETSKKYVKCITDALAKGDVRQDMDPRLFAFFLDNLLTSLQFSFTCDYYRNRLEIYTGVNVAELSEDQIVRQLLKFIESAFTFEK